MKSFHKNPSWGLTEASEVFAYNAETGRFIRMNGSTKKVGSLKPNGYIRVFCLGRIYAAHRLAWLLGTGEWPDGQVDHINGNPSDNRLCNLRIVTFDESNQNRSVQSNNIAGMKGVHLNVRSNRWRAIITANKKRTHLGYFDTSQEAYAAYCDAARRIHGQYARVS